MDYLATFHTHYSAQQSCKNLKTAGISARMSPVPRQLSASCGTCVRFAADTLDLSIFHEDLEEIYRVLDGTYEKIQSF